MSSPTVTLTYSNPVYPSYMADPFVWRHAGEYYAVGTGPAEAHGEVADAKEAASDMLGGFRIFPLLRSSDFVRWHHVGGALDPPNSELGTTFWAPEVAYDDGTFYLYYSAGVADKNHQLRVATANHPMGPYADSGRRLVNRERFPFTIDAHPFRDEDGAWYLFYARDFLDIDGEYRAGTALVVDRMTDMFTVEGEPRTVARAMNDWQRFEANRPMYGEVWDWHTLEGPSVVKRNGRYYCFYSGGRWDSDRYGVDYCVADHPLGPWEDGSVSTGPRVLRTVPDRVLGPGHNSIAIGPDNRTDFLVYHAWDPLRTARRMCIDRLDWTDEGPRCAGPTWTPQTIQCEPDPQDAL
ncbi:MAG TPA: glycoside hydrolase family 43 protein [Chthonomonadaceae bacterium]|nr:glycoside hydrolase family 43 protein [Chthonomonadaceae bacterium]